MLPHPMQLRIVIPTLDEASTITEALAHARRLSDDVVVSDGGSRDRTVDLVRDQGVPVVVGPPGRGGQLDRGAQAAVGGRQPDAFLFLHADTRLPDDAGDRVRRALVDHVGGGFHGHYESGGWWLVQLGNRLIRWRTAWTGCPLGDQAQFVRRDAYRQLEGFRDWPILEDLDLIRRLRSVGPTCILDGPATTSARRFEHQGLLRTIGVNWLIWGLYGLGVSPQRLGRLYRRIR
ncbi:MAG: TIGR04283 family arsenosugar biosynthesis glycosyltransferase [Acidobacteriota bacterium]